MTGDWIVVANGERVLIFERGTRSRRLERVKLIQAGALGAPSGSEGPARAVESGPPPPGGISAIPQHVEAEDFERRRLVRELASFLSSAATAHRFERVHLVASTSMLKLVRSSLAPQVREAIGEEWDLDLGGALESQIVERVRDVGRARSGPRRSGGSR